MDHIEKLLKRKLEIEKRRERLLGKLEVARSSLTELDKRLKDRGIDPNSLQEEINRLKSQKEKAITELSSALEEAEKIITRIESRVGNL